MEETLEERLARLAARYDAGNGEGEALTREALERLAYRRRYSGKRCDRCREEKLLSAFSRDSTRPDGLRRWCRSCDAANYRRRVNA